MNTHSQSDFQADFTFFRPKPDGDIDPAGEAGWFMQREREGRRLSLEQAGEQCGIHPLHLEGIELGDLTKLPARSEALQLIGQYAEYLGFDPQPLVMHYAQFLPQPIPTLRKRRVKKPRPLSSAKILSFPDLSKLKAMGTGAGGIVASVFAAILVFEGGLYLFSGDAGAPAQLEQMAEAETAPLPVSVGAGTASAGKDGEIVASISKVDEQPLADDAMTKLILDAEQSAGGLTGLTELIESDKTKVAIPLPKAKPTPPAAAAKTRAATPAPAKKVANVAKPAQGATGRTFGADNKGARLVLTANDNVWVRIEDAEGNVVMTQTLRKGDRYRVPARDGLVVIARDGGLLNYSIDGKAMGTLGENGEILVGRPLNVSALSSSRG